MGGREKFYWRPFMNLILKALCIFQDWNKKKAIADVQDKAETYSGKLGDQIVGVSKKEELR